MAGKIDWSQIDVGAEIPSLKKEEISREQLQAYADASGDQNPIHLDEEFAKQAGLGGVIAHGMLTMGFLGEVVTSWAWPENDLVKLTTRFKAITYPGDVITLTGKVTQKREENGLRLLDLELAATSQKGDVTASGTATLSVL